MSEYRELTDYIKNTIGDIEYFFVGKLCKKYSISFIKRQVKILSGYYNVKEFNKKKKTLFLVKLCSENSNKDDFKGAKREININDDFTMEK